MDEQLKKDIKCIVAKKWYEIIGNEMMRGVINTKEKSVFHILEFIFGVGIGILISVIIFRGNYG